jgi:hypothetical protein
LKIVQTPAGIALILCIIGATSANTPQDVDKQATVQVGVSIYLGIYILLLLLTASAYVACRKTGRGERKLLEVVALSLPVLLVRVIYSMLSVFSHDRVFSPLNGSTTVQLFLSNIEEMIVVLMYIWAGLKSSDLSESVVQQKTSKSRLIYKAGRGDFHGGRLGVLSLGAAVIGEVRHHLKPEDQDAQEHNQMPASAC